MNSIVQLFKYLGAFAAIILCIGFLSNSDYAMLESRDVDSFKEVSMTSGEIDPNTDRPVGEYRTPDRLVRNRPSTRVLGERSIPRTGESTSYDTRSATSKPRSNEKAISAYQIEEWIQTNVAQTYLESQKETMSPGVILATGVYFLQQGRGDIGMNAADVAAYLAEVRQSAPENAKRKMKYIANSEAWFEGLKLAGFDGDKIASIFDMHELKAYDKQMYSRHVERKIETSSYDVEDDVLSADKVKRNRDLADAYNDYADRPEVRTKHGLPTLTKSKPLESKEISEGRREAQSFRVGQSKKYDDPRVFWAVLKEMIALEHSYESWNDYVNENEQRANREFQLRSNIMTTGGVMKVTRKDGA